jgi:tyrosine-protein kinase Etk/Wzc
MSPALESASASRGAGTPAPSSLLAYPFDALRIAVRRDRRVIVISTIVALVAALGISFIRAPMYETWALLFLTGQSESRIPAGAAQLALLTGSAPSGSTKLVNTILRSRSLADSVEKHAGRAADAQLTPNQDGSIQIRVRDHDPRQAAAVANAYLPLLNAMVARVGMASAAQKEQVLERQIATARSDLEGAEANLLAFQRGRATPDVGQQQQGNRTLDLAVQLQQRVREKEIQVMQLRRTATPDNPQLRAAESELSAWQSQLRELTGGGGVLTPLRETPELRVTATRLMREYTKNEQVYVTLSGSLAQTRLELQNSLPVVSVIDPAPVPTSPIGPSRPVLALAAALLGAVLGMVIIVTAELLRHAERGREGHVALSRADAPLRSAAQDIA